MIMRWAKNTRAWSLIKGLLIFFAFAVLAYIFQLSAILWILNNTFSVIVIAIFIIFQPELRRGLEKLGRTGFLTSLFGSTESRDIRNRSKDRLTNEIVKAVVEMSKVKTGALIVMENDVMLSEYERTGIMMDALVSSQLLINIFEHNTPLHDGAIFIREDRVVAATCYLPLTDNALSKELGTRHRAAVGISEVSDCLTIVVSEETGAISLAREGRLERNIDADRLKKELMAFGTRERLIRWRKKPEGTAEHEETSDQ